MNDAKQIWMSHPRWKRVAVYATAGLLAAVVALVAAAPEAASPQPAPAKADAVERQFSKWDGSHITSVAAIKAAINDPDSFKHGETIYFRNKDGTIKVLTTFYARNGFGGTVKVLAETVVDAHGNVLKMQFIQ